MPEIGQNLSHYSLEKIIGKGGMGVVFRAKDQKLGRDVAIKVLPEEFARDTERWRTVRAKPTIPLRPSFASCSARLNSSLTYSVTPELCTERGCCGTEKG